MAPDYIMTPLGLPNLVFRGQTFFLFHLVGKIPRGSQRLGTLVHYLRNPIRNPLNIKKSQIPSKIFHEFNYGRHAIQRFKLTVQSTPVSLLKLPATLSGVPVQVLAKT